jgi:hypothetical protein
MPRLPKDYRMRLVIALLALPLSAHADEVPGYIIAGQLAALLAAEAPCHLHYEQAAINAYVSQAFTDTDLTAVSSIGTLTSGHASLISKQTASTLTATCASAKVNAKALGFTR